MSKSSKESLFGITLTELVIILFFIMLLLSVFNIGELRDKVKELADQVPKSEDDTLPKSTITNIVFPDGELNTNLVSVEDIEDEIKRLQDAAKALEEMESLGEGDGDCREGGFWITSKCADHCWELDSEKVNRQYEYLVDIGVCESSVVVQKSQWIQKTDQDFLLVEGGTEMLDQGVMTSTELFEYLDVIKEPGYTKEPKQCFYSVRLIDLGARSIARWENIEQEIANRVGRLPVDEGDRIYPEIRKLFPDDICDIKPKKAMQPIVNKSSNVMTTENLNTNAELINIKKASLVKSSFIDKFSSHRSCKRLKSQEFSLYYSVELDKFGNPQEVRLTKVPDELSNAQERLVRISTDVLKRSKFNPEYVEDIAVPSVWENSIKIKSDVCFSETSF